VIEGGRAVPYRDPDRQREYQREYARLRRVGDSQTPSQTVVPVTFRLRVAADVVALLEEQVAVVRADPAAGTLERARCIGYLAGVALRAIEAGDLAARLEALEDVLKTRRAG
jgi:hypothetical protein